MVSVVIYAPLRVSYSLSYILRAVCVSLHNPLALCSNSKLRLPVNVCIPTLGNVDIAKPT
jgi:hypothetical protein